MDNIPNWELGVLVQVRDLARALRNDMSRSQSQSLEDVDLAEAEPHFHFRHNAWWLPATEREYRAGMHGLERYLTRLADPSQQEAQFFARTDTLRDWLALVEKRLGNLSQRRSASVRLQSIEMDVTGESVAEQTAPAVEALTLKTSWWRIDDVFYEARGSTWALIHFLRAVEIDFEAILQANNALLSLRQIIRK